MSSSSAASVAAASSDELPVAATPAAAGAGASGGSLSRATSIALKRGASVVTLDVADPAVPSASADAEDGVRVAAPDAQETAAPPSARAAQESEGGQEVDAFADLKQSWAAK
jgi:nucleotide-binding universal stress UspA family protein